MAKTPRRRSTSRPFERSSTEQGQEKVQRANPEVPRRSNRGDRRRGARRLLHRSEKQRGQRGNQIRRGTVRRHSAVQKEPGEFSTGPRPFQLAKEIVDALQPRLYLFDGAERAPPKEGLAVHFPNIREVNFSYLKPGVYTPSLRAGLSERDSPSIALAHGDRVLLTLRKPDPRTIYYTRTLLQGKKRIGRSRTRDNAIG